MNLRTMLFAAIYSISNKISRHERAAFTQMTSEAQEGGQKERRGPGRGWEKPQPGLRCMHIGRGWEMAGDGNHLERDATARGHEAGAEAHVVGADEGAAVALLHAHREMEGDEGR